MAATPLLKIFTGSSAGTMSPSGASDGANLNLMSTDAYDSTGTDYASAPITVPGAGSAYSYERWFKFRFDGTFNLIDNCLFWKSAGSYSDGALIITAGTTDTGATPVNTNSTVATASIPTSSGTAVDITPSADIEDSEDFTDFGVLQLEVPSTVTTPGDIGTQTITFSYDEQ
jgi:hypothetical protein